MNNNQRKLAVYARLIQTYANSTETNSIEAYAAALRGYGKEAQMPSRTLQDQTKILEDAYANFPQIFEAY